MKGEESQHFILQEKSKQTEDRSFHEVSIGDEASLTRKITNQDILDFATLTGDVNPVHIDEEFAEKSMFKGRVAHGILTVGYISALIGTILPGKNVIYLSQNCKFVAPVRIGDTIKVVGKVTDKRSDKHILTLQTNAYNQDGDTVLEGSAVVMKKE